MRLLLLAPFCLSLCLLAEEPKPLPEGVSLDILVQEVQGEVDVRPSAKEKWVPAAKGMKLPPGAKLCTGVGSGVAVSFGTNSVALVSECTVCEIRTFEMRGEDLVASIHLDPGRAKVSVKQLAQFHTDFQVSTPRLTCSVRGSEVDVEANTGNGNMRDSAVCTEDKATATDQAGGEHSLVENEETDSEGDSNVEIATGENLVDPVDDGSPQGGQDENLEANNAGGIDLQPEDTVTNTGGAPSGTDNGTSTDVPPLDGCDPAQVAADEQFLTDHGLGALVFFLQTGDPGHLTQAQDDLDLINFNLTQGDIFLDKHLAAHRLLDCSQFGSQLQDHHGLDNPTEHLILHAILEENHLEEHAFDLLNDSGDQGEQEAAFFHNLAHERGLLELVNQASATMHQDFHDALASNTALSPGEQTLRDSDYHDPATIGFTDVQTTLQALAAQASTGNGFDPNTFGEAMIGLLHLNYHERIAAEPKPTGSPVPGTYAFDHPDFHTNVIDPLVDSLEFDGIYGLIGDKADALHQYWHDHTGITDEVLEGEPGYFENQALHEAQTRFQDAATQAADESAGPR